MVANLLPAPVGSGVLDPAMDAWIRRIGDFRALECPVVDAHYGRRDHGAAYHRAVVHEGESEAGGNPMIFLSCLIAVLSVATTMKEIGRASCRERAKISRV